MNRQRREALLVVTVSGFVLSVVLAGQDRFTVKSPNGIAFSEFKGYDSWPVIAPSQTDDADGCMKGECVKAIVGNAVMMKAYRSGIPENGTSVPDGATIAKIEWAKSHDKASPYGVTVPGTLNNVAFMVKDSKRFPDTDGWGYAQFRYDNASGAWTAYGNGAAFAKDACHQCHALAVASDFVFTHYAQR